MYLSFQDISDDEKLKLEIACLNQHVLSKLLQMLTTESDNREVEEETGEFNVLQSGKATTDCSKTDPIVIQSTSECDALSLLIGQGGDEAKIGHLYQLLKSGVPAMVQQVLPNIEGGGYRFLSSKIALKSYMTGKRLTAVPPGHRWTLGCKIKHKMVYPLSKWQEIRIHKDENLNCIYLKSQDKKYLSAQPDGTMQWNRSGTKEWEKFQVVKVGKNQIALKSCHGKFLSGQQSGEVYADKNVVTAWEVFFVFTLDNKKDILDKVMEYGIPVNNTQI